jgi:predicted membrane-bound mannosyltransferase
MNHPRLKYEGWLYGLAFLIALGLRLLQLGAAPLTDSEANFAMQALHIANGTRPLLGPQPAYILLTSVLFLVFESSNFMARLVPALVGSAMVFAPLFFREPSPSSPGECGTAGTLYSPEFSPA